MKSSMFVDRCNFFAHPYLSYLVKVASAVGIGVIV